MRTCLECAWCEQYKSQRPEPKIKIGITPGAEGLFFPSGRPPKETGPVLCVLCTAPVPAWVDAVTDSSDLDGGKLAERCKCFKPSVAVGKEG